MKFDKIKNRFAVFLMNLIILLCLSSNLNAQNECKVKAIIGPSKDTVVNLGSYTEIVSLSENAEKYKIYKEGGSYYTPENRTYNHRGEVGLTKIYLVAYNGNCTDTAVAYYFTSGAPPKESDNYYRSYGFNDKPTYFDNVLNLSNGGMVITSKGGLYSSAMYLMNIDKSGCVLWSKEFENAVSHDLPIFTKESLLDNSIYVYYYVHSIGSQVAKISKDGVLLWNKRIEFNGNSSLNITTDESGNAYLYGHGFLNGRNYLSLIKIDGNGNELWSKNHYLNDGLNAIGNMRNLLFKDGDIYISGEARNIVTGFENYIVKLSTHEGEIIWIREYASEGYKFFDKMINDGNNISISLHESDGYGYNGIAGIIQIDKNGNIIKSGLTKVITSHNELEDPYIIKKTDFVKSGNDYYIINYGEYTIRLPNNAYIGKRERCYVIKLNSDFETIWVEGNNLALVEQFFGLGLNADKTVFLAGHNVVAKGISTYAGVPRCILMPISENGSNKDANCKLAVYAFINGKVNFSIKDLVSSKPFSVKSNLIDEKKGKVVYASMKYSCPEFVDYCSYVIAEGEKSVCNMTKTYNYNAVKNSQCGYPIKWEIPDGVEIVNKNGSEIAVKFKQSGIYVLYAIINQSCTPVADSIVVEVKPSEFLNIGDDFALCPNNMKPIEISNTFNSYLWSNGSTTNKIDIEKPGKYWVRVEDDCENILSDTILVTEDIAKPVSITNGNQIEKCEGEVLVLKAMPGFENYEWSNQNNSIKRDDVSFNYQFVTDDKIYLKAEEKPGCFAFDTAIIKVQFSTPIFLGNDTAFCAEQKIILNAKIADARSYVWSTGEITSEIEVLKAGQYYVTVTNNYNCVSKDTLVVERIYTLPNPQLNYPSYLCFDKKVTISPGDFTSYLWQDGSTNKTFEIEGIGKYSIVVTNENGCINGAELEILKINSKVENFLKKEHYICEYETINLSPIGNFSSYKWQNGETSRTIAVSKDGWYKLNVVDAFGCEGYDSTLVIHKDCMKGLYVPNAFSPNGDGLNDIFRPHLYGNIKLYSLRIYNRWGQEIFSSNDLNRGWDGKVKSIIQSSGTFTWVCQYQLENEPVKTQKGEVLVIK